MAVLRRPEDPGLPADAARCEAGPRPTVIEVHGGPEGQARPLWNPRNVALVANGFNVLQPNVRGSTGYGKAYEALDDVRLRMDSVKDLDAAAAWLAEAGIALRDKIGVMGQSYGGYMVLAALAFFPDRNWAAAVDVYGIANFITFFEHTDAWRRPLRAVEYGDPVKDRDFLISISPITKLDAIKAPLMVIHGANDPRVPIVETEQIVKRSAIAAARSSTCATRTRATASQRPRTARMRIRRCSLSSSATWVRASSSSVRGLALRRSGSGWLDAVDLRQLRRHDASGVVLEDRGRALERTRDEAAADELSVDREGEPTTGDQ